MPRIIKIKKESDWYAVLRRYVRAKWPKGTSAALEVKAVYGLKFPFSELKEHQIRALLSATQGVFYEKISDIGLINYRPFDAFVLSEVPSYVVICFHDMKVCHGIHIEKFLMEKAGKKRGSLSFDRAGQIATFSFSVIKSG